MSFFSCPPDGRALDYQLVAVQGLLPSPPRTLSGTPLQLLAMTAAACRRPSACPDESDRPVAVKANPPKQ
eukprot:scaffold203452_cov48-Prasinocladus_malaysianus.AAC.1